MNKNCFEAMNTTVCRSIVSTVLFEGTKFRNLGKILWFVDRHKSDLVQLMLSVRLFYILKFWFSFHILVNWPIFFWTENQDRKSKLTWKIGAYQSKSVHVLKIVRTNLCPEKTSKTRTVRIKSVRLVSLHIKHLYVAMCILLCRSNLIDQDTQNNNINNNVMKTNFEIFMVC